MKKTLLSLFCVLALCLGLLPTAALAADNDKPNNLYVGNQQVISGTETTYWSTDPSTGNLTESNASGNWNVKYESSSNTLTLKNAKITGSYNQYYNPFTAGIYAKSSSNQPVALTIELIGTNTITGNYGIYVNAEMSDDSYGTDASLLIRNSSNNGRLEVSGSSHGIYVKSGTGNASLTINDASVVAKTTQTNSGYAGVCVQSGASATTSPNISLSVDGGSLTASGIGSSDGIQFYVGSSEATNATTSLTVNNNAIVKAINGIEVSRVDKPIPSGTGIVFDDKEGTVYGTVELQDDLKIGKDESLTIGKGASLTVPTSTTLTNNGTITIENGGTLTDADAITNTGTINVENGGTMTGEPTGGKVVHAPTTITTDTLNAGTVGTAYSQTLEADNDPTEWKVTTGALPDGLTLDETTGVISGTPNAAGTFNFTVTAANSAGSASKAFTIQISYQPTTITTQPQNAAVTVGQPATFTVAATGYGLTYQWQYSVDKGQNWTAIDGATSNSYTTAATTMNMNGCQYSCVVTGADSKPVESNAATLTVNPVPVTGVTLDKNTLALFTGDSATLVATVAPADATNKTVNWASSNPAIVTVDANGKVTAVAAGTANITATTVDGNKTAVCAVTVTGRTYTLSSDPGAIGFGTVSTGYTQPAAQVVVIKNTGNQALNLTQPKANNYGVGALSKTALNPGETATFIVQPKAGLGAGSYNETLTISGDGGAKATVNLTFSVQAPATATPAPTPLEIHTLHFDTNGGLPLEDVKFGLGAPVELWPYTPVRSGYLFQGWYSDQALTKAVSTIVLVKDTTIYAKWAPDPAATAQSGRQRYHHHRHPRPHGNGYPHPGTYRDPDPRTHRHPGGNHPAGRC